MQGVSAEVGAATGAVMATPFPNQPPPYEGTNLFLADRVLREALEGAGPVDVEALRNWGSVLGGLYDHADLANRHPPRLRTHDRGGERIDAVEFDDAWHALMALAMAQQEHCLPWRSPAPHAHVQRAALYYLHAQVENGTQCPLTMTLAANPVLRRHADVADIRAHWLPAIESDVYDARPLPVVEKDSALIGMGMTERQGGSDVRANLTRATRDGDRWRIRGHKWFFSAPQCDAHLVLAQTETGVGCFFMPRHLDDGTRNAVRINRLKDKLGNRSNASAEVELEDAHAWLLGEPDRGIATILEMVQLTRVDCVIGSAGIMRAALAWALHWAQHRFAFGRRLWEQPLMANVLADLALETEAALLLALDLAGSFDEAASAHARSLARLVIPASKYWVCKRAPMVVLEAMEVLGGNGYVDEQPLPRLYREAPVNSIWEGSGNVICLDVARAAQRHPDAIEALYAELRHVHGANAHLDRAAERLTLQLARVPDAAGGRVLAQAIASTVAAALLVRHAPTFVSDAYCASRLAPEPYAGAAFGTLTAGCDAAAIVRRSGGVHP
jgi:putative acyl-CoA dehydrogenase